MITPELLVAVGVEPTKAKLFAPLLEKARIVPGDEFQTISSKRGIAMLVSQLSHESGYFSTLEENLNYSVEALRSGARAKYFTEGQAKLYGSVRDTKGAYIQRANQRMIANLYYGDRLGNLGVNTDDGWTFRGAGLIQLTGRYNHTKFGETEQLRPEEAAAFCKKPEGAVKSSFWFWRNAGLLVPASRGDVTRCTEIINGGSNGLASRLSLYKSALAALV